jgi:hypothetical protein
LIVNYGVGFLRGWLQRVSVGEVLLIAEVKHCAVQSFPDYSSCSSSASALRTRRRQYAQWLHNAEIKRSIRFLKKYEKLFETLFVLNVK